MKFLLGVPSLVAGLTATAVAAELGAWRKDNYRGTLRTGKPERQAIRQPRSAKRGRVPDALHA